MAPYARKTHRLVNQQTQVAYLLGGEAGAFILMLLGMPTSPDTLLNPRVRESLPSKSVIGGQALIRNAPESELVVPRVLGVDDWAFCKGQSYGTIPQLLPSGTGSSRPGNASTGRPPRARGQALDG